MPSMVRCKREVSGALAMREARAPISISLGKTRHGHGEHRQGANSAHFPGPVTLRLDHLNCHAVQSLKTVW